MEWYDGESERSCVVMPPGGCDWSGELEVLGAREREEVDEQELLRGVRESEEVEEHAMRGARDSEDVDEQDRPTRLP